MKRIIITIFLTAMTILILIGAHYKNISSIIDVEVCKVKETRIISSVTCNGKIEEINKREIFVSTPVVVDQVKISVGDEVKKGQQLLVLDTSDLALELEKAKADEELERINLKRLMMMGNNGDAALNIQSKKCEIAKMKVAEIERKLNFQNEMFKSPIDGVVTSVKAKEGIVTNIIEPLITISDLDNLIVKVELKEYYVSKVEKGQKVEITGDAFEGITYKGEVSDISPVAIQLHSGQIEDTSIIVSVDILSKQTKLKPGYSVRARIITKTKDDALIIPYEAITTNKNNREMVFTVKNNIVKERTIKTGTELDMAVEVLDGLTKDEKIIINPSDGIKEGVKVRIIEEREV